MFWGTRKRLLILDCREQNATYNFLHYVSLTPHASWPGTSKHVPINEEDAGGVRKLWDPQGWRKFDDVFVEEGTRVYVIFCWDINLLGREDIYIYIYIYIF